MKSPPSSNSWNDRFVGDNQRYRLEQRLGKGGMGEVFLAMDTRVGQHVALKLLKDTLVASQEMRTRFEREIAVCAALQSDHIVKISDCGFTSEGYPFYVMEYLRGQTLRQLLLREKRLTVERTVNIMMQICKGLGLAHRGVTLQKDGTKTSEHIRVVHRDLKPDNIFLVPTDLGEWVKILDFGVAKIRSESSEQTNITNITSTFIGTFRYAPPEQIQSDQNLDARGDIYSLGIILYEMLSAADPFGISIKGNNVSEASWVLAHAYDPPKALRSQPGCEGLSIELEAVIMKCLQKKPDDRFPTVEALDQALQTAVKSAKGTTLNPEQTKGSNHETIPRTINPSEQNQFEDTVFCPPSLPNKGSNHETIPSINPVEQNQSEDTVIRPPSSSNQGSNHETVPSLNPVEQNQSEDTVIRPPSLPNKGSNHETIPRLNSFEQSQFDETLPPTHFPFTQGSNHETIPSLNPVEQSQPEPINLQQPPLNNPQVNKPDATLYQPRPASNQGEQQIPPDATLYQPRPGSNQNKQQIPPDATLYQPRPRNNQNNPQVPADATLYQPRPTSSQNRLQAPPDDTIYQPRQDGQQAKNIPLNVLRSLGVVLAIGLALGLVTYILQARNNSSNDPRLPNERIQN